MNSADEMVAKIFKLLEELYSSYKKILVDNWCVYGCYNTFLHDYENSDDLDNIKEAFERENPNPCLTEFVEGIVYKDPPASSSCCPYGCQPPELSIFYKKIECILALTSEYEKMDKVAQLKTD